MKRINTLLLAALVALAAYYVINDQMARSAQQKQAELRAQLLQEYKQARAVNTAAAYDNFLKKFPQSRHHDQALYYRDELLLEAAKAENNVEAIEVFINSYPKSQWLKTANWWRDNLILKAIAKAPSIEAYNAFIKDNPKSSWIDHAEHKRDGLIYRELKKLKSIKAYQDFIRDYPKSAYRQRAELKLQALQKRDRFIEELYMRNEEGKPAVGKLIANNQEALNSRLKTYQPTTFDFSTLPKETATIYLTAYRDLQSDITIDIPGRPVLLILSSYLPSQWDLNITEQTNVQAIIVGSYKPGTTVHTTHPAKAWQLPEKTLRYSKDHDDFHFRKALHWLNQQTGHARHFDYFHSKRQLKQPLLINNLPADHAWSLEWPPTVSPADDFSFALQAEPIYVQPQPEVTQKTEADKPRELRPQFLREPPETQQPKSNRTTVAYTLAGPANTKPQDFIIKTPYEEAVVKEDNSYYTIASRGIDRLNLETDELLEHYPLPGNFEPFSHPKGIAYDNKQKLIAVVSSGGDGAFYRFDTVKKEWKDYRSLRGNINPASLAYSANGNYYAAASEHRDGIVIFADDGTPIEIHNLKGKLPGYKQTYNGQRPPLTVIGNGNTVALINLVGRRTANRDYQGIISQIWEYDRTSREVRLTYNIDIAKPITDKED